jgi:hypothetical protein
MSTNVMIRPSETAARYYRAAGVWRDGGCSLICVGGGMRHRMRRDQGLPGRRGARPDRLRRACASCRADRGCVVRVGGAVVAPIVSFFEQAPWEQCHPVALDNMQEDPDRVAMVLFTSGTTGKPKGTLHAQNTCYSSASDMIEASELTRQDVCFTPHSLTHAVGRAFSQESLLAGACMVLLDSWSGERGFAALADSGTTHLLVLQRRGHGATAVQLPSDDVGPGRCGPFVARAARRGRHVDPGDAQPRPGEPGPVRGNSGGVLSGPDAITRRRSCR